MFESLKKKISSWLGKPEKKAEKKKLKKPSKKAEKRKKPAKKPRAHPKKEIRELEVPKPSESLEGIEKTEELIKEAEKEEEEIEEAQEEKKVEGFFSKLFKKFANQKLNQEQFNEIFEGLEIFLLENNVALSVIDKIRENLAKKLINTEMKKAEIEQKIIESLKDSILEVLIEPPSLIEQIKSKSGTYVIIFFGINGSGKTTTIAKLAHKLKKAGISSVMAAADTFRAASIEQIKIHGERIGIPVISSQYGADPAAVAFDAKKYAEKNNIKVVLIDTAGRMYTKQNLLKEMEKIIRVSQPDLRIFVGESITGHDSIEQAKTFNETAGIDGIILTKADVDEKAGTILSVSYVTSKPIYFLGVGQTYDDLKDFTKKEILKNLGLD